jgi:hypothetical protein
MGLNQAERLSISSPMWGQTLSLGRDKGFDFELALRITDRFTLKPLSRE